ncbi:hypothetical protein F2P79_011864 [Pimephales promelas]|nr:hypothetical protein F2P79_011864 [Pimephales promelas]
MVEHTLHPLSAEVDTLPVLGSLGLLMINSEHFASIKYFNTAQGTDGFYKRVYHSHDINDVVCLITTCCLSAIQGSQSFIVGLSPDWLLICPFILFSQ